MSATTSPNLHAVPLTSLKQVINIIFDHLIDDLKLETVSIDLDNDFYWDMDKRFLYDVTIKPPEFDIGRLTDDWEFLSKIEGDPEMGVALMLIHAAPLLRYVAEKVGR